MRRTRRTLSALTATALFLTLWTLPVQGLRRYDACAEDYRSFSILTQDAAANESLIVKTDGTLPDFRALHPGRTIQGPDDTYIVCYDSKAEAEDALPALEKLRGVEYAEINQPIYAQMEPSSESTDFHSWGVEYIHADELAERLRAVHPTEPVTVAVVDSGITPSHPLLRDRTIRGESMLPSVYDQDGSGHGTAVSGIIAECTQGLPVELLAVRILNSKGEGTVANAVSGIRYAADNGAQILNLSFAAEKHSDSLDEAVQYAFDQNSLPVISAGNYGKNMDVSPICPSHGTAGIVVSGCDSDGALYKKTCFGSSIDLCAPAVGLACATPDGGFTTVNGTSFAAPHVAGAAALLKLLVPSADAALLEQLLKESLRDMGDPGFDIYYGFGVPDLRDVKFPLQELTLDAGAGTFPEGRTIARQYMVGSVLPELPVPVREGYTFMGYFPPLPKQMPHEDLRCTALWLPEGITEKEEISNQLPTCTEEGYVIFFLPGQNPNLVTLAVPPLGHSFGTWQQTRAATQYREGEQTRACARCGEKQTRPISKLPYTPLTISLNGENIDHIRIQYRQSVLLSASEPVNWTSEDENIVSVSPSGDVTTIRRGSTLIYADSVEGGKTAQCSVEVYYTWWQWLIFLLLGGWLWY